MEDLCGVPCRLPLPWCPREIPSEQQSFGETKGNSLFVLASGHQACLVFKPTLISQGEDSLAPPACPSTQQTGPNFLHCIEPELGWTWM